MFRSVSDSRTRRNSPVSRYFSPPCISRDEAADAPWQMSPRSSSSTRSPCRARSRNVPQPLMPAPMMMASYSATLAIADGHFHRCPAFGDGEGLFDFGKAEAVCNHVGQVDPAIGDHVQGVLVIGAGKAEGSRQLQFLVMDGVYVKVSRLSLGESGKKADAATLGGKTDGLACQGRNADGADHHIGALTTGFAAD